MKILIIKLSALGDVLFATPLAKACRQAWGEDSEIHWLVQEYAEPVLRGNPSVDQIIRFEGPLKPSFAAARAFEKAAVRLRAERYDLVLNCHRMVATQLLVWLTGAAQRIGFRDRLSRFCYTDEVPYDAEAHETERYLELLRRVREEVVNPGMQMVATEEARVVGQLLVSQLGDRKPLIGMAPGGGINPGTVMLIKRWPAERFAEVGRQLVASGAGVVLCGSPDEVELCAEIAAGIGEGVLNLAGQTDKLQLVGVLAACRVVIANDSGPLHMAAALGLPTVALFGPTDPRLVAPLGPKHRFLWSHIDCAPCYRPDNARSRRVWLCTRTGDELRCLRDLAPEDVVAAVREALAGKPWPLHAAWHRPAPAAR